MANSGGLELQGRQLAEQWEPESQRCLALHTLGASPASPPPTVYNCTPNSELLTTSSMEDLETTPLNQTPALLS